MPSDWLSGTRKYSIHVTPPVDICVPGKSTPVHRTALLNGEGTFKTTLRNDTATAWLRASPAQDSYYEADFSFVSYTVRRSRIGTE